MPPTTLPGSADSKNKFEDLSGVDIAAYANPYDALIEACHDNPVTGLLYFRIDFSYCKGIWSSCWK